MPYHRTLINLLPFWGIVTLLMVSFLIISFLTYIIVRRFFPKLLTESMSPAFGVIGTSFGFVLGFAIAILWQNYTSAMKLSLDEAVNFYIMIDSVLSFDPANQSKIFAGIQNYLSVLKTTEWPAMRLGRTTPAGWNALNHLYEIMRSITPTGTETSAYGNIMKLLDNIATIRIARLQTVDPILGIGLHAVIMAGAFFILFSVAVNDVKSKLNHSISMFVVCALLAFNIGLALYLTYPFSGNIGIQGNALLEGIPARIKNIEKKKMGTQTPPQAVGTSIPKP